MNALSCFTEMRMKSAWLVLGLVASMVFSGCSGDSQPHVSPADGASDDASGHADSEIRDTNDGTSKVEEPLGWSEPVEVPISDIGESESFEVAVPSGQSGVSMRVSFKDYDADDLCVSVAPLRTSEGETWVDEQAMQSRGRVCSSCTQRIMARPQTSVFVFPNDGSSAVNVERLTGRVQVLDCATGIPASRLRFPDMPSVATVEIGRELVPGGGRLRLALLAYEDSGLHLASGELPSEHPDVSGAIRFAESRFARAGIAVDVAFEAVVGPRGAIEFGGDDDGQLREVTGAFDAAFGLSADTFAVIRVAFVACLDFDPATGGPRRFPAGAASAIPMGGRDASVILIDGGGCAQDVRDIEKTLAHELGHALGLYHSDESNLHLMPDSAARLMSSSVSSVPDEFAWFSDDEAQVMRLHPAVY